MIDYQETSLMKLHSTGKTKKRGYIATEMCQNGDLFDFWAESRSFSEPTTRYFFSQLVDGLRYMHTKGYAHCDIKIENILLDDNFGVKLADFGFATKDR